MANEHYERLKKELAKLTCKFTSGKCTKKVWTRHGYCHEHHQEAIKLGLITVVPKGTIKTCKHPGCDIHKIEGHGLCRKHWMAQRKAAQPKVVKPHKFSKPDKTRTRQCPKCDNWYKPSYFKGERCGTCARNEWAVKHNYSVKNASLKRKEQRESKFIKEDTYVSTNDDVSVKINAKALCERAGILIQMLPKLLKSLKDDGIIIQYEYDVTTMSVTLKVRKEEELKLQILFNQKPNGVL